MNDRTREVKLLSEGTWWDQGALSQVAHQWRIANRDRIRNIPASQWNGLVQEGHGARNYGEYFNAIENLLTSRHNGNESGFGRIKARWRRQRGLAQSLLADIKTSSSEALLAPQLHRRLLELGTDSEEYRLILDGQRLAMARAYVAAIVLAIRPKQE